MHRHIDEFWLDDAALARTARQSPSTARAAEVLNRLGAPTTNADDEPDVMLPGIQGAAVGYNAALAYLRAGVATNALAAVLQGTLQTIDSSRKVSSEFTPGAIALALNDATEAVQRGIPREQLAAVWEANIIFGARKIALLRQGRR